MRRITYDASLAGDPALRQFHPNRTYRFAMPGGGWRRFTVAFLILGLPGLWVLHTWRGGPPSPEQILSLLLLAIVIAGFLARLLVNKVVITPEEVILHVNHEEFRVAWSAIEDVLLAESDDELDEILLPDGHFPMEYDVYPRRMIVLILRDGTRSRSSSGIRDGVLTKYVTFNVYRTRRFLAFARLRVQ